MLAKIAHAITVAEFGLHRFEPWLPPIILGQDPDWAWLVGGIGQSVEPVEKLHEIQWDVAPRPELGGQYLVTVRIRLFAEMGGPHALVIAGASSAEAVLDALSERHADVRP